MPSDYDPIQYEVLPEISLPNGANHGLITGSKTSRDHLANSINQIENQSHRRRIISSPCRSKYETNKQDANIVKMRYNNVKKK